MAITATTAWADEEPQHFGHITYNGNATGGTLEFYMSSRVHEEGNKLTLTNGQSAALTSENISDSRVYIMATPAVGHRLPNTEVGATVDFIQAEVVTSAQQAPSRRNAPDPTIEVGQKLDVKFYGYYSGWATNDPATDYYGLYYVVMPADVNLSVSITANFPGVTTTTVDYIDPTKTGDAQNCNVTAYVLDGTETRLGYGSYNNRTDHETWYVLNKDLTYTNGLELYGKVHLILADGKTMSYDGDEEFISGYGYLDIYGQGGETEGAINVETTEEQCIIVTNGLTINGGNVSAESTNTSSTTHYGISGGRILTINGGTVNGKSNYTGIGGCNIYINGGIVNATGTIAGINTAYGTLLTITGGHVCSVGGKFGMRGMEGVIITGGQIEATGGTGDDEFGIFSDHGDIILGWTTPTDYIKANSYHCGTAGKAVKTADGQRLVALNMADDTDISASAIVSGTVDDVTLLAGKTLRPLDGNYVSINSGNFDFNESANTTTSPFTITTGEGENTTTTHYYIYKKDDTATLSYTGSGFVQVTGLPEGYATVENQPLQRTFTMAATDVVLTATAVTGLTATAVTYDGTARTPVIKQGDDVFAPANYAIAYKLGKNDVTAADVKNVNTYTCTLTGVGQYIGTNTVPFDITLRSTSLAVEIVDPETTVDGHPLIIAQDDAHVKVTLNPVAGANETTELPAINGIVTISVDNGTNNPKSYTVAIVNGEGHYYVTNLAQDAYAITASFAGDANHAVSTSDPNYSIAVSNVKTALRICFDKTDMTANTKVVTVGEPVTVYVDLYTVPSDWDGDFAKASPFNSDAVVTVKCNPTWQTDTSNHGNYTVGLVKGHGSITFSHLPADDCYYHIDAVYAGNDEYLQCQTMNGTGNQTLTLKVNKTATTVGVGVTSPVIAKEQNYE
jgi:hypothetical protein